MAKHSMLNNINKKMRVIVDDGRTLVGRLLVYDHHMNVILGECKETRPLTKKMKDEGVQATRELGLILLRGEHVVSVTVLKDDAQEKQPDFSKAPKSKKAGVKRTREEGEDE